MRFLLLVALTFTGAGQATAISTNGRIATLLQKVLPAKSAGMIGKQAARFVAGAGFIGLALCGTITGCERGEQILSGVVGAEGTEIVDDSNGQYIWLSEQYFSLVDENQQAGHFDQLQADLWPIDDFQVIPNHRDVGERVSQLHHVDNSLTIQRWGEVVDVYDNGYYRIMITREAYSYDGRFTPFQPFTMLIHQDLPWGDGGFIMMGIN